MAKRKTVTCQDLITKRFSGKYCPYNHCDYEGNPPNERLYFCLKWESLLPGMPQDNKTWRLGYLQNAQMLGKNACTQEDYSICILFKERIKKEVLNDKDIHSKLVG